MIIDEEVLSANEYNTRLEVIFCLKFINKTFHANFTCFI